MLDGTLSPGDPVFYLHHSWLDKLWWDWQNLDIENRLTDMGGPNLPNVGGGGGPGGKSTLSLYRNQESVPAAKR